MADQEKNTLTSPLYRAGWDIGGAHLKIAYFIANKLHVQQYACPLWKGIHELQTSMQEALADALSEGVDLLEHSHAVTMTGELVDAFDTRTAGVHAIIDCVQKQLQQSVSVHYFNGKDCVSESDAKEQTEAVASANWLASGHSVAMALEEGEKAPDFELQASDGMTYTLSQFAGEKPVVIAFFPKAFTGG